MIEMKNVFHANFVRYIHILIILEGVTRPTVISKCSNMIILTSIEHIIYIAKKCFDTV